MKEIKKEISNEISGPSFEGQAGFCAGEVGTILESTGG